MLTRPFNTGHAAVDVDAVVVGAGIGGLYAVYRLNDIGMDVCAFEATDGLGGTWHRNRYPGCRFDSESYSYGYSFSKELLDEWDWTERFSPQPETLRYLNYVADRFDLRRHIQFNSPVVSAVFDEGGSRWTVTLADGREVTTRFLVMTVGALSVHTSPKLEGAEKFRGAAFHTIEWPEDLDIAGKRVGVIGTGATGVQVIAAIADTVEDLTVFQLRPNWCAPLVNGRLDETEMEQIKRSYDEIFRRCRDSPNGFIHAPDRRKTFEVSEAERQAFWEQLYYSPGMGIWLGNFMDTLMREDANAELSRFVAGKIRSRVHDPEVAEKLIPKDHGFGTGRVALETGYYEVYNRPNVRLVDLRETPITRLTESGPETSEGVFDLDVLVYATGFDAFMGPFERIDIRGRGGRPLMDKWSDGPITSYGIQVHGFPNLFIIGGPQGGSGSTNAPRGLEDTTNWIAGLLEHATSRGCDYIEATEQAEREWVEHVRDMSGLILLTKTKNWFTGHNVNIDRGDKLRLLVYAGGNVRYREHLEEEAASGYPRFVLKAQRETSVR